MIRVLLLILALLVSDVAHADWLRVPATGTGTDRDAYRPVLPNGIKDFSGSPIPRDGSVPTHYVVWVRESVLPASLPAGSTKLTRAQAASQLGSDRAVVQAEKLPTKTISSSAIRFWNWVSRHIGPAIAWALSASDDFNRANGGLGANWTTATDYEAPAIDTNKVRPSNGDANAGAYYNAITPADDQWSQWTVATWNTAQFITQRGVVRQQTGADTHYGCTIEWDTSATTAKIHWKAAGSTSELASTSETVSVSDVFYCEVVGSDINMKKNSSQILTANDANISSGRVGLAIYGGTAAASEMDDWSGGDFATGNAAKRVIVIQ